MSDTTTTERTIPPGYWQDAKGNLVPVDKIKAVDKARNKTVLKLITAARELERAMAEFKQSADGRIEEFVTLSANEYGVEWGGKKGNITLTSYDGKFKVERAVAERLGFDERLQVAKQIIDECAQEWSKGSNKNFKVIAMDAFQVDKTGNISVAKVLGLRRHKIDDPNWLRAMELISDACTAQSTTEYIRFYERDQRGKYQPIALSLAAV
jgi:hypothetical protein